MRREGIDVCQRALVLAAALALVGGAVGLSSTLTAQPASAAQATPNKHRPTPTPTATFRPTPTPAPTHRPTPPPTPPPSPPPTAAPTPAPPAPTTAAENAPAPSAVVSDPSQAGSSLPYTGQDIPSGAAQATLVSPTVQTAAAADPGNGSAGQSLYWFLVLVFVGIPGMIVMTLIATVLIRR